MVKNNKSNKKTKQARTIQNTPPAKKNGQKTWVYIVRLILIGILVLALGGSLLLGLATRAYSLSFPEARAQAQTQVAQTAESLSAESGKLFLAGTNLHNAIQHYDIQPEDQIDGSPVEEFRTITNDFPSVEAPYAALCTRDGRILYARNIDTKVTMASTTKMMTAIIAIETLPLDTILTVTYGAASTGGTYAGLWEGMGNLSLLNCLYALLLPSGNDAAVTIAQNVAGMESRFVAMMNAKAAELGMTSTNYVDSSGLSVYVESSNDPDDKHYTTVRDYLRLTQYCMANPTFKQIVGTSTYEFESGGYTLNLITTDNLSFYLEGAEAIGVKTGYTDEAGYCFVGAGHANGLDLYTVVFNCSTSERRFLDTAELLEWGFRHYRIIELINTTQQVANVALLSWPDKTVPAYVPVAIRVEYFDLRGSITQDIKIKEIEGEAMKGQTCGTIIWTQGGQVLMTSPIVIDRTVPAPDFWQGLSIAWDRFWGGFRNQAAHAKTTILLKSELIIPDLPPQPNS